MFVAIAHVHSGSMSIDVTKQPFGDPAHVQCCIAALFGFLFHRLRTFSLVCCPTLHLFNPLRAGRKANGHECHSSGRGACFVVGDVVPLIRNRCFWQQSRRTAPKTRWLNKWQEKVCNYVERVATHVHLYQHLQRGAKWFLKGINSPSLRV